MGRASKQGMILDTAERLFEEQGYVATGVSQITARADVATMTLYNNFPTKDALIVAVLDRRSEAFLARLCRQIEKAGSEPVMRILAIYDAVDQWIRCELKTSAGFAGCLFLSAAAEFKSVDHPAHEAAVKHKQAITELFRLELLKLKCKRAVELARTLQLILDGSITQAQLLQDPASVKRARNIARQFVISKIASHQNAAY